MLFVFRVDRDLYNGSHANNSVGSENQLGSGQTSYRPNNHEPRRLAGQRVRRSDVSISPPVCRHLGQPSIIRPDRFVLLGRDPVLHGHHRYIPRLDESEYTRPVCWHVGWRHLEIPVRHRATASASVAPGWCNRTVIWWQRSVIWERSRPLCSVFHSVVCLSHRETFYYANFSFSAEALFRLYRQSYPLSQTGGDESATTAWRTASHQAFFPLMFSCRQEILADLDYVGMSSDQTPCSHTRKNETRFNEIELLTDVELKKVGEAVAKAMTSQSADSRVGFAVAAASLIATTFYIVAAHVTRFVAIEAWNVRVKRKRKVKQLAIKTSQLGNNHLILDQLAVNHLQVSAAASTADAGCTDTSDSSSAAVMCNNCSDYSLTNQNSNFIGFKVATVWRQTTRSIIQHYIIYIILSSYKHSYKIN